MRKTLAILILLLIPITVSAGIICNDGWESSCEVSGPGCCSWHGGVADNYYDDEPNYGGVADNYYDDEPNYGGVIIIGVIVVIAVCFFKNYKSVNRITREYFNELENSSDYEFFINHYGFNEIPEFRRNFEIMNYDGSIDDYAIWENEGSIYIVPFEKNVFSYNYYLKGLYESKTLSTINTISLIVKDLDCVSRYMDKDRLIPKLKLKNKHLNINEDCEIVISSLNRKIRLLFVTNQEGLRTLNNYFNVKVMTEKEHLENITNRKYN